MVGYIYCKLHQNHSLVVIHTYKIKIKGKSNVYHLLLYKN
jgi:hypothetical protein